MPRAMFGGVGLYSGDVFFALIAADRLYFKVGDANRAHFESAGSEPFRPYGEMVSTSYYEVPISVLEDAGTLAVWAREALAVARAKKRGVRRRGGERR